MKCQKCDHDNPDHAKFCNQCAHKFELVCPQCKSLNPPDSKFCNECAGMVASDQAQSPKTILTDEKIDKIQRYLPKGLTEKILSQKDRIEGERRQVTVMFCDMENYSEIAEQLGPEGAFEFMNQVYEILIHKVHDYEGTVNELTGDGIMALFGAPIALEDAPQRAIHSALAVQRAIVKFSEKAQQKNNDLSSLKMRIGIHTGPVVVGTLGNDLRVEFKAVGDTVNLASRMETLAYPGTTFVTEDTFNLTEGFFRFESLGAKKVKGKEKPIKVYRIIAPSSRRTRFDINAERGLTPILDRERELDLLMDAFEKSKLGQGQAFSIIAEAGLGKSRLLYEFRKAVSSKNVTFLEGRCLSFSKGIAYYCIKDILKATFNIYDDDRPTEIEKKIQLALKKLQINDDLTLPYLLELLSAQESQLDRFQIARETIKTRIFEAVNRVFISIAKKRPLILALEDLHWGDISSAECLRYLVKNLSGIAMLMIFTYRPEFEYSWETKSYHRQLNLNCLSNQQSLLMVSHLLGTDAIDRGFINLILEKTEGVPFFIEEFIRVYQGLKLIEKKNGKYYFINKSENLSIPSTIQDVIMTKVDSLPENAKNLIMTGAVIEREFSYELIHRITDLPSDYLKSLLSVIVDSELVFERGVFPQSTYIFKHSLARTVIYDSILTPKKRMLHKKVAEILEELYRKNIKDHYGVIADHFMKSEIYDKAAKFYELASVNAAESASMNEAIIHAYNRIEALEKDQQTDEIIWEIIKARTECGKSLLLMSYMADAKKAVEPILKLAVDHGFQDELCYIYSIMGAHYYMVEENFSRAFKFLKEAVNISEKGNDVMGSLYSNYLHGLALSWECNFENSYQYIEKTLDIFVSINMLWGISYVKSLLSFYVYCYRGLVNQGYQTSLEAVELSEKADDIFSKAIAYTSHGISNFYKGFLKSAEGYLQKGGSFSEQIGHYSFGTLAHRWLGETYFEMGEYEKSEYHLHEAYRLWEKSNLFPSSLHLIKVIAARTKAAQKSVQINYSLLYRHSYSNKLKLYEGAIDRCIAGSLLRSQTDKLNEAESWVIKAIRAHRKYKMTWDLARDYFLYAKISEKKGDYKKLEENMENAKKIFDFCGSEGWIRIVNEKFFAIVNT